MCITDHYTDGKRIHSTWKSRGLSHILQNAVSHSSMIQPVIHITHNADYYGIQNSFFHRTRICFYRKRL